MIQAISTDRAPKAIGPYSQAVKANGFIFVSGQIPLNPSSGELLEGPVADQTRLVMDNIASILQSAGSQLSKVVKTTIFLKDLADFQEVNAVYGEYFGEFKPARATVQVARLPRDVKIEIEAIAID